MTLEFERADPQGADEPHPTGVLVRATGDHLRIEQLVTLLTAGDLSAFLRALYDQFRGWSGERAWESLEHELRVTARHDGHVHLRWDVSNRPYDATDWTFTTTTRHGAGEDVRRLADAFDVLLGPRP